MIKSFTTHMTYWTSISKYIQFQYVIKHHSIFTCFSKSCLKLFMLIFWRVGVFLGHGNKSACCFVLYYKSNVYCTCFYCSLEQRFSFIGHIISDHIWFSTPCIGIFFFLKNFKLFWFPNFWPWTIKVLCVLNLISMFLSIHLYM